MSSAGGHTIDWPGENGQGSFIHGRGYVNWSCPCGESRTNMDNQRSNVTPILEV